MVDGKKKTDRQAGKQKDLSALPPAIYRALQTDQTGKEQVDRKADRQS